MGSCKTRGRASFNPHPVAWRLWTNRCGPGSTVHPLAAAGRQGPMAGKEGGVPGFGWTIRGRLPGNLDAEGIQPEAGFSRGVRSTKQNSWPWATVPLSGSDFSILIAEMVLRIRHVSTCKAFRTTANSLQILTIMKMTNISMQEIVPYKSWFLLFQKNYRW